VFERTRSLSFSGVIDVNDFTLWIIA